MTPDFVVISHALINNLLQNLQGRRIQQQGAIFVFEVADERLHFWIVFRAIKRERKLHLVFPKQAAGPLIAGENRVLVIAQDHLRRINLPSFKPAPSLAPGLQGEFSIGALADRPAPSDFAAMIDNRHEDRFLVAIGITQLGEILIQYLQGHYLIELSYQIDPCPGRYNHLANATELGPPGVPVETIDEQVIDILKTLVLPENWRNNIHQAQSEQLGENLKDRIEEIKANMERMDRRWDLGFIAKERQYIQERTALQIELEALTPGPNEELERAVHFLENFIENWDNLVGREDMQRELIKMILKRVAVKGEQVVALTLHSNYHMIQGHKMKEPTPIEVDSCWYTDGNDGIGRARCQNRGCESCQAGFLNGS